VLYTEALSYIGERDSVAREDGTSIESGFRSGIAPLWTQRVAAENSFPVQGKEKSGRDPSTCDNQSSPHPPIDPKDRVGNRSVPKEGQG